MAQDHELVAIDGVRLAARTSQTAQPPRATVVLAHGFSAGRDHPQVIEMVATLNGRGFGVVSYDSRGHGSSQGTCTLGDLERYDVASAVAHARGFGGPVVLVGASMGGIAVLRHAVDEPDLDGVVVVSCPAEWRVPARGRALMTVGLTRTRPGRWFSGRHYGVHLHPAWTAAEPPKRLARRLSAPLAIVHGQQDRMIPMRAAHDLRAANPCAERRLFAVPRMGHAFDPRGHAAICEAVEWTLSIVSAKRSSEETPTIASASSQSSQLE